MHSMKFIKIISWWGMFLILSLSNLSCATRSQSRWMAMGAAAPVGAAVGALSSPGNEKPEFHAFAWSSFFVAVAAIIGGYYYNDDEELQQMNQRLGDLNHEVKKLNSEVIRLKHPPKFELITEGKGYFKYPHKKDKNLVKWKVYKVDKWIPDGEDTKYHQDLMIKRVMKSKK